MKHLKDFNEEELNEVVVTNLADSNEYEKFRKEQDRFSFHTVRPTFLSTYSEASNLIERFRKEVEGTVGSSDEITRALAMSLNSLAKAASIATDLDR